MKRSRVPLLVMATFLFATAPAVADSFDISAVNKTGGDVFDVHVLISGTGGTIHNLVPVSPAVQALDAGPGNEVNGSWDPALGNGNTWEAKFDVDFNELVVAEAYWTDAAHHRIADIPVGDVQLFDLTTGSTIPEPATLLLFGTGALALLRGSVRRRPRGFGASIGSSPWNRTGLGGDNGPPPRGTTSGEAA